MSQGNLPEPGDATEVGGKGKRTRERLMDAAY